MTRAGWLAVVTGLLGGLGLGCAGGQGQDPATFGMFDGGGGESATTSASSGPGDDDEPSMPPDLGACDDDDDCTVFDTGCYENGKCIGGVCDIPPKLTGAACDDGDPCSGPDVCDGDGTCLGDPVPCVAPNATGGMCMAGLCMGLVCDPGFGNCNGDWIDGCESPVVDDANCGACGQPCVAGPNATASCNAGACEQQCEAPWSNCDGDWANGCEIPEGVPNQCDVDGLNPNGCWTAQCGQSNDPLARNFGTWFCFECTTCHVPAAGLCQWCDHDAGRWFPMASCSCGAYEDLACGG